MEENFRELLRAAARETQDYSIEIGRELERQALDSLGIEIIEPEVEWFRAESKSVYDEFAKTFPSGADLLTRALAASGNIR